MSDKSKAQKIIDIFFDAGATISKEHYDKVVEILEDVSVCQGDKDCGVCAYCEDSNFEQDEGRWVPEEGEKFYKPQEDDNIISEAFDSNDGIHEGNLVRGNFYKTKQQAQQKVEKLKAIESIRRYCSEEFGYDPKGGWKDWDNGKRFYVLVYNHYTEHFRSTIVNHEQYIDKIGYFKQREHAQDIIENCKEELKAIFDIE